MPTEVRCRQCGQAFDAAVVDGRFDGVCPRCLAKFALATEVESREEAPLALKVGATFRGIEVVSVLGRGGMGVVYKARQTELGRDVALKVLAPDLAKDPEFVERFNREARALATLSHPNIVSVYEFGREGDLCFLAMEFVEGRSLRDLMSGGRLPIEDALRILPQICEALEHAHAHGVVHRDIKPENVLVDKAGRVKLAEAQEHAALTCVTVMLAVGSFTLALLLSAIALLMIRASRGQLSGSVFALAPLVLTAFVVPVGVLSIYVGETRPATVRPLAPGEVRGEWVGPNLEWLALTPAELPPGVTYAQDEATDAAGPVAYRGLGVLGMLVALKVVTGVDLDVSLEEVRAISLATVDPGAVSVAILELKRPEWRDAVAANIRSTQQDAIVNPRGRFIGVVMGDRRKPEVAMTADAVAAALRSKLERVEK